MIVLPLLREIIGFRDWFLGSKILTTNTRIFKKNIRVFVVIFFKPFLKELNLNYHSSAIKLEVK